MALNKKDSNSSFWNNLLNCKPKSSLDFKNFERYENMKNFNRYKYGTYTDKNGRRVVVAISRHAGKVVKGVAKCSTEDTYDFEKGKELASARCNAKVCAKRLVDAQNRVDKAKALYQDLLTNSEISDEAKSRINDVLASIRSNENFLENHDRGRGDIRR